jgi:lysophospholipase L1-like esterase
LVVRFGSSVLVMALVSAGMAWLGCSSDAGTSPGGAPGSANDGGATDGSTTTKLEVDSGPAASLEPYRIVGRFDARDPAGPRFGWPGTQVIAKFSGESISVDLSDTSAEDQFDVSIDDEPLALLKVDQKEKKTYELGSGLSPGVHTLTLTKRTESSVGETQLLAINATLVGTPPPAARRIEMIGDSITAGYGVLGADSSCVFSPETENESLAWGALAAKELNAVHTAIAWSGIGLVQNYEGETTDEMPDRYGRALATDAASAWTANLFEPDVIVIALGTNDLSGEGDDPGDAFQTKLVEFLTTIRAAHANSQIVLASSPMLEGQNKADQERYFQGAIDARKAADPKISLLKIDTITDAEGFGCDYHPSKVTQARMATALVAHVKTLTGW